MALTPGTKLGPYEIVAPLGAGGMGEVYRGRDTRLERTVAIKVLAARLVGHPDTRKRFEREARALSGLSHPHICTLHDIGCQEGVDYLVMEYLEGETLAQRLNKGPLSADQVLRYGIEIADALEKAHRQNVVHRDLKPGNIMLTKAGAKLLDFGLARLITQPLPGGEALMQLTTQTRDQSLTEEGVILGTFQYMAPEQLEGKEADARADIFALGEVIYEMSTGKPAFSGKSRASLIAAILASEPPSMTEFHPLTPPALERVVKTCLAKDPDARWQSAQDLKLQLEWIRDAGSQAGVAPAVAKHRINRERMALIAASFLLVVAGLFSIGYLRRAPPAPLREMIFTVDPPPGYKVSADGVAALSPDGARLAYAAEDSKGKTSLWVRSLESLISKRIEGSESSNGYYSFVWTPDGSAVIAQVDGKLTRLSVSGGANDVLCEKFDGWPNTINRDGTILAWFAPPTKIVSISGDDCTPRPISSAVTPEPGIGYAYPHFLPDGKHFLFAAVRKDKHNDVLVGSLDGAAPRVVVRNASFPKYIASGHILFSRDGYLMAQRFDEKSLRSNGEPFLVYPNQLDFAAAFGWAAFDASINGVISAKEQAVPSSVLRWYSRGGEVLQTIGEPDHRIAPRLTVQGTRAVVCFWDPRTHASDIWSVDLERGAWRRESFQERPGDGWAVWSPDGEQLIYSALMGANWEMLVKKAGSTDNGQILQTGLTGDKVIGDWSADGRSIVYIFEGDAGVSLYGQSLGGGKPFLLGPAEEGSPRLSPDGRWVAYQSNESGSSEVYVRPFTPDAAASEQVSSGGGHDPRWSRSGNELFYRTDDWRVISVPLSQGKQLRFGKPFTLFRLPQNAEYDVIDGKRFLVNEPVGLTSGPLFMIINWKPEAQKSH